MLTMNIHQLKHITFHVRNWGPLWSFSCFGFESINGDIKKLFHGTREMSQQVSCMSTLSISSTCYYATFLQMIFGFVVLQQLPRVVCQSLSSQGSLTHSKLFGESQR